jgi:hypothetical protein
LLYRGRLSARGTEPLIGPASPQPLRGSMQFHANYVSTSVFGDGDYYQATFEAEPDTDNSDSPYLVIQRQFEDPDDDRCYVETHDKKYCGHFLLRRIDFTPQKLSIKLDRPTDNFVSVTLAMMAPEFAEASQVVKIISGELEPP